MQMYRRSKSFFFLSYEEKHRDFFIFAKENKYLIKN